MDNIAKDIINVGIGAIDSIKKIVDENSQNLQNMFKELAAKGASDQSDTAIKLRESVDKAVDSLEELREKVDVFVQDQQDKLNVTIDKIKVSIPDLKIDDLKVKVEELSKNIRSSIHKNEDGSSNDSGN